MARERQSAVWHRTRQVFRWCRIAVLVLTLALLVALIWLNQVGLPEFAKRRLVAALQAEGIDLHFTSMRLHWYRGIVADRIYFGRPAVTNAPQIYASEAELRIRPGALLHGEVRVSGVALRGGHMTIPVWGTNDTPRQLALDRMQGEVKILAHDQWELIGFSAKAFGVKFQLAGAITNGSAIRTWKLAREKPPRERSAAAFWYDMVERLEASQFEAPSDIIGQVHGDALEPQSFRANLHVNSPGVDSPWGRGRNVSLSLLLAPAVSNAFRADATLEAREVVTRWGEAAQLELQAKIVPSFTRWTPTNAHVLCTLRKARTRWGNAGNLSFVAEFQPNPADAESSIAEYALRAQQIETRWARVARAELNATAVLTASNLWPTTSRSRLQFAGAEITAGRAGGGEVEASLRLPALAAMRFADTNLTWWTRLDQVEGDARVVLNDVHAPKLDAKKLSLTAEWKAPLLVTRDVHATLYDGELAGAVQLHSASRELTATFKSSFDPHRIAPLLSTNAQHWLDQYTWQKPPVVNATVRVVLPAWTNQAAWPSADWRAEVQPTLQLAGDFQVGNATYRSVPINSADSSFSFSNFTWRLPRLVIARPEGLVRLAHVADNRTHRYEFFIESGIDPRALKPLLGENERALLDEFEFSKPPQLRGSIAGAWHSPESTSMYFEVAATNLAFRHQPVKNCRTTVTLTNQLLVFAQPEVERTEGVGRARSVRVDLPRQLLYIDEGRGRLDPTAVTRAVGTDVAKVMEPYHFSSAPDARVHGVIALRDSPGTDIRFEVSGGPFQWKSFHFQQISGVVHWLNNGITLSNIGGLFHGGHLEGGAVFDFGVKQGSEFSFRTLVSEVNLQTLATEVGGHTNKVEGLLNGLLVVTNANSEDFQTWNGYGNLTVQDGLLWDFPIFGVFSPVINTIKPGAGNSRAKDASATFVITNGTIHSSDLVIHASGMRLKYSGTVDFDARVKGRMEAQLFRDTPGLGPLVSTVLWPVTKLFEYRIAGTLSRPEPQPLYIPRILTAPFHPLRTLRELMTEPKNDPGPEEPE